VNSAVLVDIVRTGSGRGKPGGALAGIHPVDLLAQTFGALMGRVDLDPALIDDVIVGCVSQVGDQAANVARTAALVAGLPESVPGTTVDRQCGSSQQAVHFAAQGVIAGAYDVVIAGGVEMMSRLPIGIAGRGGAPRAPLRARYPEGLVNQGVGAELIASRWKISRDELDDYAARSHQRASATAAAGGFDREIVPVDLHDGSTHQTDETIRGATTSGDLAKLSPAFYDAAVADRFPEIDWHITAGTSSPFTDGASAALIMSEARAAELGLAPRARFRSFAVVGSDPLLMLTGVIPATEKLLGRAGLKISDIDVYEVNEAFASVPLAWAHDVHADPARLNPRGGALALGHPLGGSGVRVLATMVSHLEESGGRLGLQVMCEGGGMANATLIERL
jgi:acetyl-CoA acyltransferase